MNVMSVAPAEPCFENFLELTGWGIYNKLTIFLTSACCFCSTVGISTLPFVLPKAAQEMNFSAEDVSRIYFTLPVGMIIGGIFFAILSDMYSRKCVLTTSLLVIFCSSLGYGFSCNKFMMSFFTFSLGFSAFANKLCAKVYLIELLPVDRRGRYLMFLEVYALVGFIMTSCIQWAIRDLVYNPEFVQIIRWHSWRIMFGLSASFSAFVMCLTALIHPTPRELLGANNFLGTQLMMKYIFSLNYSEHAENLRVPVTRYVGLVKGRPMPIRSNCRIYRYVSEFRSINYFIVKNLFVRNRLQCFILVLIIRSTVFQSFVVANNWLIKSLNFDYSNNSCQKFSLQIIYLSNTTFQESDIIWSFIPVDNLFHYLSNATCTFVVMFLIGYFVDLVNRKLPLMLALFAAGFGITGFTFVKFFTPRLILSMLYVTGITVANAMLDLIILENVPVCMRALILTASYIPAKIIFSSLLLAVDYSCYVTFEAMGIPILLSIGCACYLPNLTQKPMVE